MLLYRYRSNKLALNFSSEIESLAKIFFHCLIKFILTRNYHFSHSTYRKRHHVKINDNSRPTKLRAKERAFVTSHVNIYVRGKGVHSRMLPQCKFSFLYHVRIKFFLCYCELSLINACCCRADATINSFRLCRHELIHRNLPSNIMHKSR